VAVAKPKAYELGSEPDATFTNSACARSWLWYEQSVRRTSAQPAGALIACAAASRAETAAIITSPVAAYVGRATVSEDEDADVAAAEADRNVGEPLAAKPPSELDGSIASTAATPSATPREMAGRRTRRRRSDCFRAGGFNPGVMGVQFGSLRSRLDPSTWEVRQSAVLARSATQLVGSNASENST
jgi:hypothetical protein